VCSKGCVCVIKGVRVVKDACVKKRVYAREGV